MTGAGDLRQQIVHVNRSSCKLRLPRNTSERLIFAFNVQWSGRRGSNSQQPAWKAGTLPIELRPHKWYNLILFKKLFFSSIINMEL